MAKKFKGQGSVSGAGPNDAANNSSQTVSSNAAFRLRVRRNKPKAAKLGAAKGSYRKVEGGWKRRKFSVQQRRKFRSRQSAPNTSNNGPR